MTSLLETFLDDRGGKRELLPNAYRTCVPQVASPLPLMVQNRVRAKEIKAAESLMIPRARKVVREPLQWWHWALIIAVAILGVASFASWLFIPPPGRGPTGFPVPPPLWVKLLNSLPGVTFYLILISIWFYRVFIGNPRQRPTRVVAEAIAAEGFCPACAYSLAAIKPQSDGCRVCPECGCAMKLSPTAMPSPQ